MKLKDQCAVFGVYGAPDASEVTYLGLYSLQHRGQESSGIVTSDHERVYEHRDLGLVAKVYDREILAGLKGELAIGHNRYSTTGLTNLANIQPLLVDCKVGKIAVGHNGNIVNAGALRREMEMEGSIFRSTTDSEVILHLIARSRRSSIEEMIMEALEKVEGAFSLTFLTKDKVIAARDRHGFRPLCLGRLDDAYVVASESCAFDIVSAMYMREVAPGEVCVLGRGGPQFMRYAEPAKRLMRCIFEFIYFSRPDSKVFGENVDKVRRALGRRLAVESTPEADLVIAVPDSSNTIALGFSEGSKIPFELGLIRNHYVGRTFIQPRQTMRDWDVRIKFNPVRGVLKGKRIVVVDDSIVRGSTMRKLITMLRQAGADKIHLRIGSPPITHSCYYGIDTPTRGELIASSHTADEIREYLGVESLHYLSREGLLGCVEDPDNYCVACFGGGYPVSPEADIHKEMFEKRSGCGEYEDKDEASD